MNIDQMAHEFAMKLVGNPNTPLKDINSIVCASWSYVDAMQAEADKRKPKGLPEALQDEFTIDWSIAPEWANYWTIDLDCNSYWYRNKPSMVEYGWESNGGIIGNAPNFKYFSYSDKFRDSLRKRP